MTEIRAQEARPQPKYKNYNERVHVITGDLLDRNDKNSGYERYTEKSQSFATANKSLLPSDLTVRDPITGRDIVRK